MYSLRKNVHSRVEKKIEALGKHFFKEDSLKNKGKNLVTLFL